MIHHHHLELNVTRHCNNACVACNHLSPIAAIYNMPLAIAQRDLTDLSRFLHVRLLSFQGGEPLLHPQLSELIETARDIGIADKLQVLSNGRLVEKMPVKLWRTLRDCDATFRVSQYPNLPKEAIVEIRRLSDEFAFDLFIEPVSLFRVLISKKKHSGSGYHNCPWKRCLTVHEGFFYLCPLTAFFPGLVMPDANPTQDGIPLEGMTEEALQRFLNREEPLEACKMCEAPVDKLIPWTESRRHSEWMEQSIA